jgi:hypothetical protein
MSQTPKTVTASSPLIAETASLVDKLIKTLDNETEAKLDASLYSSQMELLRSLRNPELVAYEIADIVDRFNYSLTPTQMVVLAKVLKPVQVVTLLQLNKHGLRRQV